MSNTDAKVLNMKLIAEMLPDNRALVNIGSDEVLPLMIFKTKFETDRPTRMTQTMNDPIGTPIYESSTNKITIRCVQITNNNITIKQPKKELQKKASTLQYEQMFDNLEIE